MRKIYWFIIIINILFILTGVIFYPHIQDQMATHWSMSKTPDSFMGKSAGVVSMALISIIIIASSLVVNVVFTGKIGNKNKQITLLIDSYTILMSLFLFTIYIAVLVWNTGVDFSMPKFALLSGLILSLLMLSATFYCLSRKPKIPEETVGPKADYSFGEGRYKDSLIEICDDTIIFENYYLLNRSKKVNLSQVEYIEEKLPTIWNGKYRLSGTGDLLFRIWFPADYNRPNRDRIFVMKIKNKWTQIGFTVENSNMVSELFARKGLLR